MSSRMRSAHSGGKAPFSAVIPSVARACSIAARSYRVWAAVVIAGLLRRVPVPLTAPGRPGANRTRHPSRRARDGSPVQPGDPAALTTTAALPSDGVHSMTEAAIVLDPRFVLAEVDRRLLGSFVEHMGRCVYTGIYEPDHPT